MIWEANAKGAGGEGHMAVVNSYQYDAKRKVHILTVRHANWVGKCPSSVTTFNWSDLGGVRFYVKK